MFWGFLLDGHAWGRLFWLLVFTNLFSQSLSTVSDNWWGLDIDGQVNWKLHCLSQLSVCHNKPVQHPHYRLHCPDLSFLLSLHCPLICEQDPTYLGSCSLLHLGQHSSLNLFQLKTMASDLEVLIFIPAASHLAAKHPSVSWSLLLNKANRSTKSSNRIPSLLNLTPLHHSVHKSYEQNQWQRAALSKSPILTRNESDLLPEIQTRLQDSKNTVTEWSVSRSHPHHTLRPTKTNQ